MNLDQLVPGRTYRVTIECDAPGEEYDEVVYWREVRDMVFGQTLDVGGSGPTPLFNGIGGWDIVMIEEVDVRSYGCGDRDCAEREATGRRCPWCWGGYPVTADRAVS